MKKLQFQIDDDLDLAIDKFECKVAELRTSDARLPQVRGRANLLPIVLDLALQVVKPAEVLKRAGAAAVAALPPEVAALRPKGAAPTPSIPGISRFKYAAHLKPLKPAKGAKSS